LLKKPEANLVVISVPGEFAARESHSALDKGLNVFLFSGNVPIEEEVSLKKKASAKGLLMIWQDCGTSLIGGVGIGFANNVRIGDIGVIGASGTGLQEFTSQVHNAGFGISHAIGTGSNDLSDEIGGLTTITALNALEADPNTRVIAIVSKPPGKKTLEKIGLLTREITKPVIGCFLGVKTDSTDENDNLIITHTLDEAVKNALSKSGEHITSLSIELTGEEQKMALREREKFTANQKYSRGIFAGGTFCYQSQQIFQDAGIKVYSNGPIDNKMLLADPDQSKKHTFVDMGDEYYTVGTPHPMIDATFRNRRIGEESRNPEVAILLLDFILGHNASMDPVGDLLEAIIEAKRVAVQRGDYLCVVASLCGTEDDPQDLKLQEKLLMDAGVIAFTSNAKATMFCLELLK
jgi:succinyl-CoA synthetase alpha subunit